MRDTTHFWNNLYQEGSFKGLGSQIIKIQPKGLSRIAKIDYDYLCQMELTANLTFPFLLRNYTLSRYSS